jgi:uncharacterized protein (UPF0332 family)
VAEPSPIVPQLPSGLWPIALENYQAAKWAEQQTWYNVSVACSYYAVFTAMWVALGPPPEGSWKHKGITGHFARGAWRTPPQPVEREVIKAIRRLYDDRLKAHYTGERLTQIESVEGLMRSRSVLTLVADAHGFSLEGILP